MLLQGGDMQDEWQEEYENLTDEQLRKLGVEERKKKQTDKSLEQAQQRNKSAIAKNRELQSQLIEMSGGLSGIVPVETEKEPDVEH